MEANSSKFYNELEAEKLKFQNLKIILGFEYDSDYDSATFGCTNPSCVRENTEYANGWVTNYNIIGRAPSGYIPGVSSPASCQQICRQSVSNNEFP